MAQNTDIALTAGAWTLLTDGNVTALRVQNKSNRISADVLLQATSGATPPSVDTGAIMLGPREIIATDYTLAQLFPGVSGANRVYAKVFTDRVTVSVSHA